MVKGMAAENHDKTI